MTFMVDGCEIIKIIVYQVPNNSKLESFTLLVVGSIGKMVV